MDPLQNQAPQPSQMPPVEAPKKSVGPLIGIIVIVILLILGALYVWGGKLSQNAVAPAETTATPSVASDEVDALQAELEASTVEIDLTGLE